MCISYIFIFLSLIKISLSTLCYNCSSTHRDDAGCAGDFVKPSFSFNSSRRLVYNCTGEDTMCFVRSWSARAKHAWIVQRGCYQVRKGDLLPRTMTMPTRSMSCKIERLPDAEYKICFCQADWCNPGLSVHNQLSKSNYLLLLVIHVLQRLNIVVSF